MIGMDISVQQINASSPYKVTLMDNGSLSFQTNYGVVYEVGFIEDYTFLEKDAYQFYILEKEGGHYVKDPLIRTTIGAIIENFFANNGAVMLYICDMSDGKQSLRNRLFSIWYGEYEKRDEYTFLTARLEVDGVDYYASVLTKNTNPQLAEIIDSFENFIENMREKLS